MSSASSRWADSAKLRTASSVSFVHLCIRKRRKYLPVGPHEKLYTATHPTTPTDCEKNYLAGDVCWGSSPGRVGSPSPTCVFQRRLHQGTPQREVRTLGPTCAQSVPASLANDIVLDNDTNNKKGCHVRTAFCHSSDSCVRDLSALVHAEVAQEPERVWCWCLLVFVMVLLLVMLVVAVGSGGDTAGCYCEASGKCDRERYSTSVEVFVCFNGVSKQTCPRSERQVAPTTTAGRYTAIPVASQTPSFSNVRATQGDRLWATQCDPRQRRRRASAQHATAHTRTPRANGETHFCSQRLLQDRTTSSSLVAVQVTESSRCWTGV